MDTKLTELDIPVPPAPVLEQAVGYENTRNARYLALWWEPAGDEAMVSDGYVTFTGNWAGYLAYIHHTKVFPQLKDHPLGSSEEPAQVRLIIDLHHRKALILPIREAEQFMLSQWRINSMEKEEITVSMDNLAEWIETMNSQYSERSMEDVFLRMQEERQHVTNLTRWLDSFSR